MQMEQSIQGAVAGLIGALGGAEPGNELTTTRPVAPCGRESSDLPRLLVMTSGTLRQSDLRQSVS